MQFVLQSYDSNILTVMSYFGDLFLLLQTWIEWLYTWKEIVETFPDTLKSLYFLKKTHIFNK